jgi:micrococcal nuclease
MSFFAMSQACRLTALLVLCALALGAAQAAAPRGQDGVVTWVTDGDSLWFTPPGKPPIQVRLRDIDAPETCQPWGTEAKAALEKLAFKQAATLFINGRDTFGRSLGTVVVDGLDVAQNLVENGHAWSSRSRWDQGPLVKQERMARALGRGLHGVPGAVKPGDFRRSNGPCKAAAPAQPG